MATVAPTSDVSVVGWTAEPPGNKYEAIDEASPSDADYIWSYTDGAAPATFGLSSTIPAGTHTINLRSFVNQGTASMRVRLLNGSDVVQGTSNYVTINTVATTYPISITTTGDATRLRIELSDVLPAEILMVGIDPLSWNGEFLSFT